MQRLLVLAIVSASSLAFADVHGELSAGGGADSTAPDGFGAASANVTAAIEEPELPIRARGMFGVPEDGSDGAAWLLTGVDPDEKLGAGVDSAGELHLTNDRAIGIASGHAWARWYGWGFALNGSLQPPGGLHDRFWRSGRDIVQSSYALDFPPFMALGTARTQVLFAGPTHVEIGHRRTFGGQSAGWDRNVTVTIFRVQRPHVVVDALTFDYSELGVATSHDGPIEYGTSATTIDLDAAAVKLDVGDGFELAAHAGVASRFPIGPYVIMPYTGVGGNGSSETSSGPEETRGTYWVELRHRDAGHTASLGAGTWLRLDPSGHAVDAGHLVSAQADWRVRRVQLGGELDLGRLHRVLLGQYAPADLAPLGTDMTMGRGELSAGMRLVRGVNVVARGWVEHSDRDDPRWSVPADGTLATHAGGDLTARWQFREL